MSSIQPWTNYKETKCRLYWCLIEFIDRRCSQSRLYFRLLLWTSAPLTFSLLCLFPPLPCVKGYVFLQCVTGGDRVVWRAYTLYLTRFRTYKIALWTPITRSRYRSIFKKSRHLGFVVIIVMHSAIEREHLALENMKFLHFFLLWVIFAFLDPDPHPQCGSGFSRPTSMRIRIHTWLFGVHNTEVVIFKELLSNKLDLNRGWTEVLTMAPMFK
jgi:hypothetical protein